MSDDLINRLRDIQGQAGLFASAAADRIEELEAKLAACEKYRDAYAECDRIGTQAVRDLEAKLAKAVEALGEAIYLLDPDEEDIAKKTGLHRIVTTYAELTGGKDE